MTPTQKFIATVGVLVVLGAGAYYYVAHMSTQPTTSGLGATSTPQTTASSTAQAQPHIVTPDYKKPIAFSATVTPEIRTQLNAELKLVQAQIAANALNIGPWVNLGTIHKQGGDYTNALLYWQYVVATYTGKYVPYYSLGDLYENNLHDLPKAEANYKLAIEVDPLNVNAYASLYTMYHYTLHDDTKASHILEDGLKANPGNNYLLGLQAELNK